MNVNTYINYLLLGFTIFFTTKLEEEIALSANDSSRI